MTSGFDASVGTPDAAAGGGQTETGSPSGGWQRHLAVLADLDLRPPAEHVEVYQGLHAELQAALADIDGA